MIDRLISLLQAAFVPGRTIHENSILAHELFHILKKRRTSRKLMAIRPDIEKAYDRMEWNLILVAMKCFGFDPRFVRWIEQCLSFASYFILFNGSPFGLIKPTQGRRQRDHMAPFLFIIGSGVLSCILLHAEADYLIHGICITRLPFLSCIFFLRMISLFSLAPQPRSTCGLAMSY